MPKNAADTGVSWKDYVLRNACFVQYIDEYCIIGVRMMHRQGII